VARKGRPDKRNSAKDTRLRFVRCPTCGLANVRGQSLCGHCRTPLPDLDTLQDAIDESPKLQQYLRSIRQAQRRRRKIKKAIRAVTGRIEKPSGFYVALAVVPGLGHIARGERNKGLGYLVTVVFLLFLARLLYDEPGIWLPLTIAALAHTYTLCELMDFKPPNGYAAMLLTGGIWLILMLLFYLPLTVIYGQWQVYDELGRVPVGSGDAARVGYSLLALILLCGAAAMASAYYSAKSRFGMGSFLDKK